MSLVSILKSSLEGEVFDDPVSLDKASRDASLFELKPELVVAPLHTGDVCRLVQIATEQRHQGHNVSLTARSAGTDMSGGPLTESVVVSMTPHFDKVISINKDSAVVEPGVYYRDFEKQTLRHGLILPCYTSSRELCTIGGMVANNSRIGVNIPVYVAGFERGVRPIGD